MTTDRRHSRASSHAALDAATASDWIDADGHPIDEEDRGLLYDLGTLNRRKALALFGGLGALGALAACGTGTQASSSSASSGSLTEVPDETAGPYPGDGSNGPDVLDDSGIVRSDIRSSFGTSTTTAQGVPLTIRLTVRDVATGAARSGAGVYLWHCNRDGKYSLYSPGVTGENYLRGVQEADSSGTVTFTSVYPACYDGRWPHIHFEVYSSLADATADGPIVKTSQIALPAEACQAVYATDGYSASVSNLSRVSLSSDNVFGNDSGIRQIATMSGDAASGCTAALTIGV